MADQQDVCALLNESGEPTFERTIAKAGVELNRLDNVTLNIAVTGESGVGKSTFVNAIRGLTNTDKGAAPTGVTETTMEPTEYPHPTMPKVIFWDLPGIGSPTFKAKTYMKDVKYQKYDLFIIVSASRFKENDMMLAKEIKKKKKNFYFLRTKSDIDVTQEEKKGVTEEQTLQTIRKDCLKYLLLQKINSVFLITSHNLERFDFQELVNTLEKDLPDNKRDALVMSLPVYSKECLDRKYSIFKKAVWAVAIASGGIAAVPVPGLSIVCDVAMVASFLTKCYHSFGLDEGSLERLSKRVNKPTAVKDNESSVMMIFGKLLSIKKGLGRGATTFVEELFSFVPAAGTIVAAGVSFAATRSVLQEGVNEQYSVAKRVLEMAELK